MMLAATILLLRLVLDDTAAALAGEPTLFNEPAPHVDTFGVGCIVYPGAGSAYASTCPKIEQLPDAHPRTPTPKVTPGNPKVRKD